MIPSSWRKDAGVVENEVVMQRKLHRGSFLVIEGPDDLRFWQSRVAPAHCELITGDGKQNVEGALVRLDRRGFAGALGIVDDDFDALVERPLPSSNLLATDAHDLECVLLRSSALERLLAEYGDPAKIRRFEDTHDCTVRTALIERGLVFGRLRWLALRCGWDLGSDVLRPERFADRATWDIDIARLHGTVIESGVPATPEGLQAAIRALPDADPWSICQGHDLLTLLQTGLQRVLGNLKSSKGVADVAALLRASYDEHELHTGALGCSVRHWESVNPPYRVLGPPSSARDPA